MPSHTTLASAIDKNRIASSTVYLVLLEVDVIDPTSGTIVETIYACNNNENFTFDGRQYIAIPFTVEMVNDQDTSPSCTLTVYDLGQIFQAALQAYGWSLAWPARIKVINADNPTQKPDVEQDFQILDATATSDQYSIAFTVGAENPLSLRFPTRQQFADRCFWKYKGPDCKYAGSLASCDFTKTGTNGCAVHNNVANFSGFPGANRSIT